MKGEFLKEYTFEHRTWKKGEHADLHPNHALKLAAESVFQIDGSNYVPTEEDIHNEVWKEEIATGEKEAKKPKTKQGKR